MPTDCAVCYVSDVNFLMPTFMSAMSLRKYVSPDKAAVYIFVIDASATRCGELRRRFSSLDINILPMNKRACVEYATADWHKSHVPLSSIGRLFIPNILPEGHKRILYLDGDTYVIADPSSLVGYDIQEGRFAAVEDISYFRRHDPTERGQAVRKYFRELGINPDDGYFNGGVFVVGIQTWTSIAKEALAFFKRKAKVCTYHDQSALNAVVGNRRLRLSLSWNFQTPFRYLQIEPKLAPRIYHFTQYPKPWMGPIEPWVDIYSVYEQQFENRLFADFPMHRLPKEEICLHNLDATRVERSILRYVRPLRIWLRKRAIRAHEGGAILNGSST